MAGDVVGWVFHRNVQVKSRVLVHKKVIVAVLITAAKVDDVVMVGIRNDAISFRVVL